MKHFKLLNRACEAIILALADIESDKVSQISNKEIKSLYYLN